MWAGHVCDDRVTSPSSRSRKPLAFERRWSNCRLAGALHARCEWGSGNVGNRNRNRNLLFLFGAVDTDLVELWDESRRGALNVGAPRLRLASPAERVAGLHKRQVSRTWSRTGERRGPGAGLRKEGWAGRRRRHV